MAILDLIYQGSYATVENINFKRRKCCLLFDLVVWESPAKNKVKFIVNYSLKPEKHLYTVDDVITAPFNAEGDLDIPALEALNKPVLITDNSGDYHNHIFVERDGFGSQIGWGSLVPFEGLKLHRTDTGKTYEWIKDEDDWVETDQDIFTSEQYEQFFGASKQDEAGQNLTKCVYEYLLSRQDFSNITGDE